MANVDTRQFTLRIPASMHADLKRLAAKRESSMSRVAAEAVAREITRAEDEAMAAGYEALADDEESNVEMFFAAQAEVVLRDE